MARSLTGAYVAELTKQLVRPVMFCEVEFSSGLINVWSGVGTIVWNAKTWTGLGRFAGVSPVNETGDVVAEGVVLSLSGIPADLISKALGEIRQGKQAKLWFGFLDASEQVIADPFPSFHGRTDTAEIEEVGETATIRLKVESRLIDLNRPRDRRYTHEDQQIDYPGDLGFEYVASLQDWNGVWGKQGAGGSTSVPPSATGGGPKPGGRQPLHGL